MPNPKPTQAERFAALSLEHQAQLLDPAEAEFAAHGYEGASLNRILERAGFSKGRAYHYASGKAALYCLVIERALARIAERVGPVTIDPSSPDAFWASLQSVFERGTGVLAADPELAQLARGIYAGTAGPRRELRVLTDRVEGWVANLIDQGQQAGAIRRDMPTNLLVTLTLGMTLHTDRWFAEHWDELSFEDAVRLNTQVIDLFRNAFAPTQSERDAP